MARSGNLRSRSVVPTGLVLAWLLAARVACGGGIGACCLGDGACLELTPLQCDLVGGLHRGDGTSCPATPPCTPFGACCFPDALCDLLDPKTCAAAGGQYQGDGAACLPARCSLRGACCFADGVCAGDRTFEACAADGGVYRGFGSTCGDGACVGACSLLDGTCLEALTPNACAAAGGSFLGHRSDCTDIDSAVEGHQIVLAFEQNETHAIELPRFDPRGGTRLLRGVTLQVDGAAHARVRIENTGDLPLDTSLEVTQWIVATMPVLRSEPLVVVDVPSEVLTCDPVMLPPGAACDYGSPLSFTGTAGAARTDPPDDLSGFLGVGALSATVEGTGIFRFLGVNFSLVQAPHRVEVELRLAYEYLAFGACCAADGACVDLVEPECAATGGVFLGAGVECAVAGCVGACCLPAGTCGEESLDTCAIAGGEYRGFAVACADIECAQACCLTSGACVFEPMTECMAIAGRPQGYRTNCTDYECPEACCLPGGACDDLSPTDCNGLGGVPKGAGTDCATSICLVLQGACCLPTDACTQSSPQDCNAVGGEFLGGSCSGIDCAALCRPDLNNDGIVGLSDLLTLLQGWGDCISCVLCTADINDDCTVDFEDLIELLLAWGPCPD